MCVMPCAAIRLSQGQGNCRRVLRCPAQKGIFANTQGSESKQPAVARQVEAEQSAWQAGRQAGGCGARQVEAGQWRGSRRDRLDGRLRVALTGTVLTGGTALRAKMG